MVFRAPPILKWMYGHPTASVIAYAKRKGFEVMKVDVLIVVDDEEGGTDSRHHYSLKGYELKDIDSFPEIMRQLGKQVIDYV